MQPQSPYGPSQPYNPPGPGSQPQDPNRPYPNPDATAGSPYANSGQSIAPGQPSLPQYTPPPTPRNQPPRTDNLPPPPPAPTTPYDFFMDPPKPHTPLSPLSPTGKRYGTTTLSNSSRRSKFAMLAGAGVVVVVLLTVITALLPNDPTATQWFAIAQRQQEIIRVCSQGTKAKYRATRNFAITCQTGVTGSQRELLAYMDKSNLDYDSKQLAAKQDAKTDSRLKSAASSSTYDETFREIVESQLTSYNRALTAQLATTSGPNGREVLTKNQRSTELLLLMVKDNSDKTEAPVSES